MSIHPTKRELREQRRSERVAAEQAAAAAGARRRRTFRLLAAAGLAAVAVAGAAIASSSGGQPPAPVAAADYLDLQCPACAAAASTTLPELVRDHVRSGEVKLEARTLHFLGPDSERAARFAAGAAEQGRLWPFLEAFYAAQGQENSGYVTDEFLRSVARAAGVDADAALAHAGTAAAQERLNRANADAQRHGIESTPAFTVARAGEQPRAVAGNDAASVTAAIERERAR
jgi:protein-disulfide isomerase